MSEVLHFTSACGERVERRPDVIMGRISFVTIHTRPTEARDPSPEVYRAVREASRTNIRFKRMCAGKGLKVGLFVFKTLKVGQVLKFI